MKDRYCTNCYHPLDDDHEFCGNCGQKKLSEEWTLRKVIGDFFGGLFNTDSKIIRTPLALLRPGFLTKEYFRGRHVSYTPPGRLLLFLSVIYFTLLVLTLNTSFEDALHFNINEEQFMTHEYLMENRDSFVVSLKDSFGISNATPAYDSLVVLIGENNGGEEQISFNDKTKFKLGDVLFKDPDEIIKEHNIEGVWLQHFVRRGISQFQEAGSFVKILTQRIPWAIIFSLPILGLCLQLLYVRRKRFFVEHIIFLIHCFSFFYLIGIPFLLMQLAFGNLELIALVPYVASIFYLFPAMKYYYGQGWIKTYIKYWMYLWLGSIVLMFVFCFLTTGSFLLG